MEQKSVLLTAAEKSVRTLRERKQLTVSHDGGTIKWLDIPAFAREAFNRAAGQRFTRDDDTLTVAQFMELWVEQSGRCALTGIEFDDERVMPDAVVKSPWSPSLDRKDSTRGYNKDNVRLVVTIANFARNVFDDGVFDRMCRARAAKLEASIGNEVVRGWKTIDFPDVPSVNEFMDLTLALMAKGYTNSDEIREAIRMERRLLGGVSTGRWNDTPSDKFVNNHAHALVQLQRTQRIVKVSSKVYRPLD